MKVIKNVNDRESLYMRMLYQKLKLTVPQIAERFPQYSRATIYRHINRPLTERTDRRSLNTGRPPKLTNRDNRQILRKIPQLRKKLGTFTIKRLQLESGVSGVSTHTVRCVLHKAGYQYLQSRKKGLLKTKDCQKRMKFARENVRRSDNFWTDEIGMFLDGTSFVFA